MLRLAAERLGHLAAIGCQTGRSEARGHPPVLRDDRNTPRPARDASETRRREKAHSRGGRRATGRRGGPGHQPGDTPMHFPSLRTLSYAAATAFALSLAVPAFAAEPQGSLEPAPQAGADKAAPAPKGDAGSQAVTYYYPVINCWPRVVARSPAGSKGSAAGGASARPRGAGARSRSRPGCAAPGAREEPRGR